MDPRGGPPSWQQGPTVRIPVRSRGGGPRPPRRPRWRAFVKYWVGPFAVAVVAGIILLAVEYDWFNTEPDAPEMTPELHDGHWQTNGGSGDATGAYAEGDVWRQSDGGVFVTGFLKDTKGDSKSALLEVEAVYADGPRKSPDALNSLGKDNVVPVGVPTEPNAHGYLFPDGVEAVQVRECLSEAGAGSRQKTECGSAPAVIWSKHP